MPRLNRLDNTRLVWALVISLLLHGGGYGVYEGGKRLHLWEKIRMPAWIQKITQALNLPLAKQTPQPPPAAREAPLMFVEVNPKNAVAEPPKNAKYYAAQSTRAANPDPERDTGTPKITGKQELIMRTEDTQLSKAQPLQPAPPQHDKEKEPAPEEIKPKPTLLPGELTMAKPADQERKTEGDAPKPKPRTVAEAKARLAQQQRLSTAGERAKQDGGVKRFAVQSSLDAVGSPFGVYDAAMIAAIQERWYSHLEKRSYASDGMGKVTIQFRLHPDGRITNVDVVKSSVDDILSALCQLAILDNAPYAPWPREMRLMVANGYRDLTFTFYYN